MTRTELKKIAKANNVDMTNIKLVNSNATIAIEMQDLTNEMANANIEYDRINNSQLPEVEKMIKEYNREAKKLVNVSNTKYWGMKYGDGTWMYELGEQSQSTKLALANID